MTVINKVCVLGAGQMGTQIAVQVAMSGFKTVCYSRRKETIRNSEEFSKKWIEKQISKGKLEHVEANVITKNLSYTDDIQEACKCASIVIETVADILEIKQSVLKEASRYTSKETIFASNSSYIVSSRFADSVPDPSKVCNMHFFNPALVMKVVEVVKGEHTSDDTFETVCDFTTKIGKEPIRVTKEIYGFIVNRVFSALTREACYLYDLGIVELSIFVQSLNPQN